MDGISSANSTGSYIQSGLTSSSPKTLSASSSSANTTSATYQAPVINSSRRDKEVSVFDRAVQNLNKSLKVFKTDGLFDQIYSQAGRDSAFQDLALDFMKKLVTAYNQLNDAIRSSSYVTQEGKKLLSVVNGILHGRDSAKWAEIGITVDKDTGTMKLDETKFADFVQKDPDTAKQLLSGNARGMQFLVNRVTNTQDGYFFYKPFQATV